MAAYRVHYSSSHVLIRLREHWKKVLGENFVPGAVLMGLSKVFDCIPHDLLIVKLHAYGFGEKAVTFIYSYLKKPKQIVKIDNIFSFFQTLLSGVPHGLTLRPILFKIFLNDVRLWHMKNSGVPQSHASPRNSEVIDMWKVACHPPSRRVVACDDYSF